MNMKHLTSILEFLKVSDYKKWVEKADWKIYKEVEDFFKQWPEKDKNANRIYMDIEIGDQNQAGIPNDIEEWLRWYGYPIVSKERAIVKDKDGREMRLGRLLNKLGKQDMVQWLAKYRDGKLKKTDNLKIVISRHPYDIIGMSTGRGWTTCHDIDDKRYNGEHLYGLEMALNKSLVAYLIREDDKNIENPISRALITKSYYDGRYEASYQQYGTEVPEFTQKLREFCVELNRDLNTGFK